MGNEPCPFWEQNGSGGALSEGVTVANRTALACGNVVQQRVCGVRAQFASREARVQIDGRALRPRNVGPQTYSIRHE